MELELSSTNPELDLGALLDQPGVLAIHRGDPVVRYVHGLVSSLSQGQRGLKRTPGDVAIDQGALSAATLPRLKEHAINEKHLLGAFEA